MVFYGSYWSTNDIWKWLHCTLNFWIINLLYLPHIMNYYCYGSIIVKRFLYFSHSMLFFLFENIIFYGETNMFSILIKRIIIKLTWPLIPNTPLSFFRYRSLQRFEAYNSWLLESLSKLQGKGVTQSEGFVWRRIGGNGENMRLWLPDTNYIPLCLLWILVVMKHMF